MAPPFKWFWQSGVHHIFNKMQNNNSKASTKLRKKRLVSMLLGNDPLLADTSTVAAQVASHVATCQSDESDETKSGVVPRKASLPILIETLLVLTSNLCTIIFLVIVVFIMRISLREDLE